MLVGIPRNRQRTMGLWHKVAVNAITKRLVCFGEGSAVENPLKCRVLCARGKLVLGRRCWQEAATGRCSWSECLKAPKRRDWGRAEGARLVPQRQRRRRCRRLKKKEEVEAIGRGQGVP